MKLKAGYSKKSNNIDKLPAVRTRGKRVHGSAAPGVRGTRWPQAPQAAYGCQEYHKPHHPKCAAWIKCTNSLKDTVAKTCSGRSATPDSLYPHGRDGIRGWKPSDKTPGPDGVTEELYRPFKEQTIASRKQKRSKYFPSHSVRPT